MSRTDNKALRALMSLPPATTHVRTEVAAIDCPAMVAETGDHEIDLVIWIRRLISTGNPGLIARAMQAAEEIQTPLEKLEKKYLQILQRKNPGNWTVAFQTFGFADLIGLAKSSTEKARLSAEARARMGDAVFDNTPAEDFCAKALEGLHPGNFIGDFEDAEVDARFQAHPGLMPFTLADCLHELNYWSELYWMRHAVNANYAHDGPIEAQARRWFIFRCLAAIPPRTEDEAMAVYDYLESEDEMGMKEAPGIVRNLISGGFKTTNPQEVCQ